MALFAVIDTNVLVSALLSKHRDSATVQVVERLFEGDVVPLFSEEILKEYNEVLLRKKFNFSRSIVELFVGAIEKLGQLVSPKRLDEELPDIKDLPFYEVVVEKRESDAYLVTGNIKHFPQKPFIVTASEFLEILNSNKR